MNITRHRLQATKEDKTMIIIERNCPRCANKYQVEITRGRRMCLNCMLCRSTRTSFQAASRDGRIAGSAAS